MERLTQLKEMFNSMGTVVVAFSGGVDSALLVKVAYDVLEDKAVALTAVSESLPMNELEAAKKLARQIGIKHVIVKSEELKDDNYAANPIDRCYYCKKELFIKLKQYAKEHSMAFVAYGANADDLNDYRPGLRAADEFNIRSPLQELNLTKKEIREISLQLGLPTADKPNLACLSSRIPYGERITAEKLGRVDKAENFIRNLGIKQLRVRSHDRLARIEVDEEGFPMMIKYKKKIEMKLRDLGFSYITLDLQGYREGSMNEVVNEIK